MKRNSLGLNPQMWEYGGLRMNEVNFLKFCLYIHLIKERDKDSENPYNTCWFPDLINESLGGRPTVSEGQLWYYVYKWNHQFICPSVSLRSGWFEWKKFQSGEYYLDTYLKIYNEIEEQVRTKDLTIDMVMKYYNPKEPTDILPFYTTVYPEIVLNLSKRKILYRYACMMYWEIKDNTWELPNKRVEYRTYDYQFYVSNEEKLRGCPKPQLPAIRAFERWGYKEYSPILTPIKIINPALNSNSSEFTKDLKNIVEELKGYANEYEIPIITSTQSLENRPFIQYIETGEGFEDLSDFLGDDLHYCDDESDYPHIIKNNERVYIHPKDFVIRSDEGFIVLPEADLLNGSDYNSVIDNNYERFDVGASYNYLNTKQPLLDQMIRFASFHKSDNDTSLKKLQIEWVKRRKSGNGDDLLAGIKWSTLSNPFEERYSCACGYLRGKLHEDDKCGRCNGVVKYVEEKTNE